MKKIFTLLAATFCSMISFAQDLTLEDKNGTTIANGATVTVEGEYKPDEFMKVLAADVFVRNNSASKQLVYLKVTAVSGEQQCCWAGSCTPLAEGASTEKSALVEAGEASNLEIDYSGFMVSGDVFTRTVAISVWTDANPADVTTATVTYTNDPTLLNIESTESHTNRVYAQDNVLRYNFVSAAGRQLQVYDLAGKLQKNIRLSSEAGTLSLEGMSKGLYLYRVVENGKNLLSGKLTVK